MIYRHQRQSIRSYVLRQGRMTKAQQRVWQQSADGYVLPLSSPKPFCFRSIFARQAPITVEVGCGNGEAMATLAKSNPHQDYIGFEVYRPGVGRLLQRLLADDIKNVRVIVGDILCYLPLLFVNDSINQVNIFFPDPWQKKRHHKRRLIRPAFVAMLADKMKDNAYCHLLTDCQDYADVVQGVFLSFRPFKLCHFHVVDNSNEHHELKVPLPMTAYHQRALLEKRAIYSFLFQRVARRAQLFKEVIINA